MKNKNVWMIVIGVIVFASVFTLVYSHKSRTPEVDPLIELQQVALKINQIGYVGHHLMACIDDNQCPTSYDPQSALGLMPFVKLAEDEAFIRLKKASENSSSLKGMMTSVGECSKYCSCPLWQRFLESQHGGGMDLVMTEDAQNKVTCPPWSELQDEQKSEFEATLKMIEAEQN
jgi:hypothetical protein